MCIIPDDGTNHIPVPEELIEDEEECHCVLPEQSCPACRAAARLVYEHQKGA